MRISDWSSDVCSSDLEPVLLNRLSTAELVRKASVGWGVVPETCDVSPILSRKSCHSRVSAGILGATIDEDAYGHLRRFIMRSARPSVRSAKKGGVTLLDIWRGHSGRHLSGADGPGTQGEN